MFTKVLTTFIWLVPITAMGILTSKILLTQEGSVYTGGIVFLIGLGLGFLIINALTEPREVPTTTDDRTMAFVVASVGMVFAIIFMVLGLARFQSESIQLRNFGLLTIGLTLTAPFAVNYVTKRRTHLYIT